MLNDNVRLLLYLANNQVNNLANFSLESQQNQLMKGYLGESYAMTLSLKYQKMYAGGSGVCEMTQVRLMVEPLFT